MLGCTTWTLTKRLEKKLDSNYTRMLRAILNKSWRQHPTRHQLYGHLLPITKTIQVRRTRHAGHCWRSRDELIRDVLLWTPTHGHAKAGWPTRTYIQQLCEDTGCCPEDLPRAMNDREEWRERFRYIRATSTTWWWRTTYPCQRHSIFFQSIFDRGSAVSAVWVGTPPTSLSLSLSRSLPRSSRSGLLSVRQLLICQSLLFCVLLSVHPMFCRMFDFNLILYISPLKFIWLVDIFTAQNKTTLYTFSCNERLCVMSNS